MKLNGLEDYFETVSREIVDFKQVNTSGDTPLMFAFKWNKTENLNLTKKQLDYLIKNSDFKQFDSIGWYPLMYALKFNTEQNLNLNNNQLDYLIQNSDLKKISKYGGSPLMLALIKNKEQLLELKKIQSEFINNEILNKIDIKEIYIKNNKI